jgi:CRP/FNR family cyclic AMP-dependent transcriptional regulator
MMGISGTDALRQVPLFAGLGDAELFDLATQLEEASFPAGRRIFEVGDANSSLHIVREGKVKAVRPGEDDEIVLKVFGTGEFFGELSLLDDRPRSAAVVTMEPTTTYVLPRKVFLRFVETHPPAAIRILAALADRLRETTERLSETIFLSVGARVAKRLEELADRYGRQTDRGTEITVSLSADELAPLVGATAGQVDAELRSLEQDTIIDWNGSTVTIRKRQLLGERTRGGRHIPPLGHIAIPSWLLEP